MRHAPPVRPEKQPVLQVAIPCIEVLQACIGVAALADEAPGLVRGEGEGERVLLAEGAVGGTLGAQTVGLGLGRGSSGARRDAGCSRHWSWCRRRSRRRGGSSGPRWRIWHFDGRARPTLRLVDRPEPGGCSVGMRIRSCASATRASRRRSTSAVMWA